ncbi:RNA recognition motif-containing protein RRM [Dictyostelium discoideum AX4]|uniref:RNA recognition motif-containing protein RRM n=1 Tax=Dictyostelium discoideum TaxID=44689 RepID=Q54Z21_DICDI|nr:RNA recognition motif-containing protein RRM [Dictyostelium discoideum AX4]EAL68151.1 RNA recognition motif-containing protein RRM [Dictyostelium discoideum AX4]|eukprot:XP_642031.1 RNA recognition motif-containing protein RRM [Dictyostelium discoideum AX4]
MEMINTVAASFLLKYFTLLIKTPENLKDFYHQNSKITRRFENGKANILTSYDNINEFLVNNSAKFGGNANISSIDCQPLGESIFMTCIGSIGFDGNVRRFLQSFYLEKIQGSFFISNDIFAFTSDEVFTVAIEQPDEASNIEQDYQQQQQQTVEVESTTTTTTTTTAIVAASPTVDAEIVKQPEEPVKVEQPPTPKASNVEQIIETTSTTTTTTTAAAAAVTTINASTSTPTPTETKAVETTKKPEPTTNTTTNTTTPAEKPKETTPAPHQKQTWAQLVLINSTAQTASASEEPTQSSSSSSSQPSSSPSSSSSSVNNNSNTTTTTNNTTTTTTANKQKDDHHFSKDGNTVFISFKSSKVDQAPIKEAFNQFGVVSNVRILTGYGFVEFEKPESVQNALNYASTHSNKINVAGNIIKVEERRGALPTGKQQQQSPPSSSSSPSSSQPLKQQPQQPYKRQPQNNGAINLKYNNQQNKPNLNGNNINNNNNNNNNNNSNNQNNFRKPQKVDNKKEASK